MPSSTVPAETLVRPSPTGAGRGRVPLLVVAVGVLAVVESLVLLAVGLTSLDGVFGSGVRPDGGLVALALLLLASWVVLCAGGGANLVDGAGRRLLVVISCGEVVLLLAVAAAGVLSTGGVWLVGALPVPALALLGLGVPTTKLLLADSPAAAEWLAAGPRPRVRRPALPPRQRLVRGVTLGVIALALTTVALVGAPSGPATAPDPAADPAAVDAAP